MLALTTHISVPATSHFYAGLYYFSTVKSLWQALFLLFLIHLFYLSTSLKLNLKVGFRHFLFINKFVKRSKRKTQKIFRFAFHLIYFFYLFCCRIFSSHLSKDDTICNCCSARRIIYIRLCTQQCVERYLSGCI